MLSVANVRTAGAAATYFAADNYYTQADADRSGEWFGKGAQALGLEGRVEAAPFEAVLKGLLPDGARVGSDGRRHRAGTDLTFSLPKSWSLIALVGRDERIIDAYGDAIRETLAWAEKNLAETRMEAAGKEKIVATGNLVVGLFRHDTNRNQEPNAHFHAVVANVTESSDGKWRALRNDKLWEHNTLLNAMTMARFRLSVEKLGYEIGEVGKHGNFEAAGVPKSVRDGFSSRRQEVLEAAAQMHHQGPRARDAATLMTRVAKSPLEDRAALLEQWSERASELGFDASAFVARANARVAGDLGSVISLRRAAGRAVARASALASSAVERLGLRHDDPLLPRDLGKRSVEDVAAAQAAASAIRHLGEREAAFARTDIFKAALDFGLPTAMPQIERRLDQLLRQGLLLRGRGADAALVTTADALASEQRLVAAVDEGRGAVAPIVDAELAGSRLQALAQLKYGLTLNQGQENAGRLLLGSRNRIVAIQGIAGAGKSTVLKPAADVLREQGRTVLGLAVQNTLVQMLERDTGIPSMTVARFLRRFEGLLGGSDASALAEARAAMRGAVVLLDEASMVGNRDKEALVRLANLLELGRFASIGDRKQLGAVDAGKPFDVMQRSGVETAAMDVNVRAREPLLRDAQAAAQGGRIEEALRHLAPHTVEVAEGAAVAAAAKWLSLPPAERERTAIYASGRSLRSEVNQAVQTGLRANGELGSQALGVNSLSPVNATHEELRYLATYAPGMVLEVDRWQRVQNLAPGSYRVVGIERHKSRVVLEDARGREVRFTPGRMRPRSGDGSLQLFEIKPLELQAGDRIRWTSTDHQRGLLNADQARITGIDTRSVHLTTSTGMTHQMARDDPMLRRLDLAYALNAHMAQGLTSDRGIAVMDSRERKLSNQQMFLVTITRLRDGVTLYVDDAAKLGEAIERNPGAKRSALETVDLLGAAAARGQSQAAQAAQRGAPERERSIVKPFEIGI